MSQRRPVTRADLQGKLRQIRESLQDLLQRAQQLAKKLAKKAVPPAGSVLLFLAYRRSRRKKRRTLVEVRRA
jgi:hypothetical protein